MAECLAILHSELTRGAIVVEHGNGSANVIGIWIMKAELIRRCVRAMILPFGAALPKGN